MIDHEDPFHYLDILNERMAAVFRSMDPSSATWITHAGDAVIARIAADTGFRNETFHQLDVTELTESSEGWRLKVPRSKFKNPDGPYFRLGGGRYRDFDRVLTEANGSGDIIEAYLSRGRPALDGAAHSDALLISRKKSGDETNADYWPRMLPDNFSRRLRGMTELYLCGGSGAFKAVEGAMPFTTHQCRALVCAGKLKRFYPKLGAADALQVAADAICDGVDVAEYYYARWDARRREDTLRDAN
jgi:hypothetical protein